MDIDKLEGRELAAHIAELVMKLPVKYHTDNPNDERWYYIDIPDHNGMCPSVPDYPNDIAAAYTMEERIEELGLVNRYCWELIKIANANDRGKDESIRQTWGLIHATPEDRCRAALKALDKE